MFFAMLTAPVGTLSFELLLFTRAMVELLAPVQKSDLRERPYRRREVVCRRDPPRFGREGVMKDFSDAAFSPEVIEAMSTALENAVATLPAPLTA
jgi:hypothetical protein